MQSVIREIDTVTRSHDAGADISDNLTNTSPSGQPGACFETDIVCERDAKAM